MADRPTLCRTTWKRSDECDCLRCKRIVQQKRE